MELHQILYARYLMLFLGPPIAASRYAVQTSGFSDMFSYNAPYGASCLCLELDNDSTNLNLGTPIGSHTLRQSCPLQVGLTHGLGWVGLDMGREYGSWV